MANNSFETVLKSYNTEANNLIIESWKTAEAQQRNAFTLPHLFYVLANNQQIASVFEQLQYTPQQVQNFAQKSLDTVPAREGEMAYEQTLFSVLQQANIIAKADHSPETSPYHLLLSLLQSDHPLAQTLRQQGITPEKVQKLIVTKKKDTYMDKKEKADSSSFGEDLVALAKEGKLNPVIGRETEFRKLIEILSRKQKRNALILGEPWVGKTVIVDLLAQKIADGEVPEQFKNAKILSVNLGSLISGSSYRGQFEEKVKALIEEAKNPDILLFIDEIHNIHGAGKTEGSMDMGELLKPELSRGAIKVIGATTTAEYHKTIEKDTGLARRFENLTIEEPNVTDTITILRGLDESYEKFHGVEITDDALIAAAQLTDKYIKDRSLPDKAITVIDAAATRIKLRIQEEKNQNPESSSKHTVEADDIAEIISEQTGIPLTKLQSEENEKLLNLEKELATRVIGQDEAVSALSDAIRRARIGLKDPKKPMGSFLFLWPTGVGKTELAKALAEQLFGDEKALIRVDMSEYKEEHTVSKLIWSPPGYIGYGEGGQLTQAVRKKPYSVVLLDEVEKAHYKVFDIFLQVLDDGRLTDGQGKTIDFKNTIIIMTSNVGSFQIMEKLQQGYQELGELYPTETEEHHLEIEAETTSENSRNRRSKKKKHTIEENNDVSSKREELKKEVDDLLSEEEFFRPEFLNRVDDKIIFNPISPQMFKQILEMKLNKQIKLIAENNEIILSFSNAAKNFLAQKWRDPANGARPIERALQKYVISPLAKEILGKRVVKGDIITVDIIDNQLIFQK